METELKLLVAPEDLAKLLDVELLRELRQGDVQVLHLHTRYYDTPSRDLARAGIALRVRRAGSAWIQTLKAGGRSAGGLHERIELEWSLTDATLDFDRLTDTPYQTLFADAQLRQALQPVFETEFERTAVQLVWPDGARAEFALDHGEVRAGPRSARLSEAEIELIEGDTGRLFALALELVQHVPLRLGYLSKAERGAALATGRERPPPTKAQAVKLEPDMSVAQALSRIGLACLAHIQANEAGALAGADGESLHQLRVGLRRLRVLVALLRFVAPKSQFRNDAKALRALAKALNKARDWDVYIDEMLPAVGESVPQARALAACAERRRTAHRANVNDAIAGPAYSTLMLRLARRFNDAELALSELPENGKRIALDAPVGELATATLDRYEHKLRKVGARLNKTDDKKRHAIRIRTKKLRYAAEFFGALYPAEQVQAYVAALRDMQEALGTLNDLAQFRRRSRKAIEEETEDVLDAVNRWADKRHKRELERCAKRWRTFAETPPFWS